MQCAHARDAHGRAEIVLSSFRDQRAPTAGDRAAVLSLRNVSALDDNGRSVLKDVDLNVQPGEISASRALPAMASAS